MRRTRSAVYGRGDHALQPRSWGGGVSASCRRSSVRMRRPERMQLHSGRLRRREVTADVVRLGGTGRVPAWGPPEAPMLAICEIVDHDSRNVEYGCVRLLEGVMFWAYLGCPRGAILALGKQWCRWRLGVRSMRSELIAPALVHDAFQYSPTLGSSCVGASCVGAPRAHPVFAHRPREPEPRSSALLLAP